MSVFAFVGKVLIHVSDDGWMTRCGIRAFAPASASDLARTPLCKRCTP